MTAKTKRKPKQQTVILHIGEHKIKGLKASKSVVAQLKRHALDAQRASVGQKPAWTEPQPEPAPAIYRPPYTHEAVGTDMTRRNPPSWLMWWYIWRFRRSLKRASLDGQALPGWRRRCLNVVKNWRGPTPSFEPILKDGRCVSPPTERELVEATASRVERAVRPVIHFWRQTTGAWLDDPA